MTTLRRRTGFEVELLAPEGSDRRALARSVADAVGGCVATIFHTDSEPSLVPGMGRFWHLTPGFAVTDRDGAPLAEFVDDITLDADLRAAPGPPTAPDPADGWFRIVSDDARLLRLVERHERADVPFGAVLESVAAVFGTSVDVIGPIRRLDDASGATVAMATALARGRQRPCEIVTAPLVTDHHRTLELLLGQARELGFTVPREAAVHLHVDGGPFRAVQPFANLVRLFGHWREQLRAELGTNPALTRIGPLPAALVEAVEVATSWSELQGAARDSGLTKFFDVNLTALLDDEPVRDTVEVRVLAGSLDADAIVADAALVERLLDRCLADDPVPSPQHVGGDLRALADHVV